MAYRVAIFTAIFGDKDKIKEPKGYIDNQNIDYFLISDDKEIKSNSYNLIYRAPIYDDITKNARYYKIFGLEEFSEYDFVIWHDANLQIIHDKILDVLEHVKCESIAFFKHPDRDCIYDEAIKCIQLEKDHPFKILRQVIGYYIKGMKRKCGLYETSIVVKNNKLISIDFLRFWWSEIKRKSRRDQLSLPYALKKFSIEPGIIKGDRETNDYSYFSKHFHLEYNFLSQNELKLFNRWHKSISIKLISLLKKGINR